MNFHQLSKTFCSLSSLISVFESFIIEKPRNRTRLNFNPISNGNSTARSCDFNFSKSIFFLLIFLDPFVLFIDYSFLPFSLSFCYVEFFVMVFMMCGVKGNNEQIRVFYCYQKIMLLVSVNHTLKEHLLKFRRKKKYFPQLKNSHMHTALTELKSNETKMYKST